ncbi:MAG: PilW family protein [Psychrobacter nivimaris]
MDHHNKLSTHVAKYIHNERQYGYTKNVAGFTLIELMISLVLGLLISAAVIQVYIVNTRTVTIQQSASEVQDSTIFALQSLEDHIRITNLGNPITSISDTTNHGGIVLTSTNLGTANKTETAFLTNSAGSEKWIGISNITGVDSDQLTIQYKNITPNDLYDCEGGKIASGSADWVVERYFVRLVTNASAKTNGVQDLTLACAAGRVSSDGTIVSDFDDAGSVIVPAIDQFKILLGIKMDINKLTYLAPSTYLDLTEKPPINTVKLGVIIRSTTPLITDADQTNFTVLGTTQNLKADTLRRKHYRRSYESTILLRNARLMDIVATAPTLAKTP